MSAIEYNNLVFNTIQRLRELNVGEQLRFMCRGKLAPRDEQNLDLDLLDVRRIGTEWIFRS